MVKKIVMEFEFEKDISEMEHDFLELFSKHGISFVESMKKKGIEINCNVYATCVGNAPK